MTVNDVFLQPSFLEFIYRNATKRDYFSGALSANGYSYPKALGKFLPHCLQIAHSFMEILDLESYAIMDESQGTTAEGTMDLTKSVVDAYFSEMPRSIGFVNGYGPAHTFGRNNRSVFLSYDYYLDPGRSAQDAAEDLQFLAKLNSKRPYYIAIHVREFSDITRVEQILNRLPKDDFQVQPLDWLFRAAASNWTFTERYEPEN